MAFRPLTKLGSRQKQQKARTSIARSSSFTKKSKRRDRRSAHMHVKTTYRATDLVFITVADCLPMSAAFNNLRGQYTANRITKTLLVRLDTPSQHLQKAAPLTSHNVYPSHSHRALHNFPWIFFLSDHSTRLSSPSVSTEVASDSL